MSETGDRKLYINKANEYLIIIYNQYNDLKQSDSRYILIINCTCVQMKTNSQIWFYIICPVYTIS